MWWTTTKCLLGSTKSVRAEAVRSHDRLPGRSRVDRTRREAADPRDLRRQPPRVAAAEPGAHQPRSPPRSRSPRRRTPIRDGSGGSSDGSNRRASRVNSARHRPASSANRRSQLPHRRRRPTQPRRDRPVPGAGRLRQQRRTDHLDRVHPAQQARHRQQHMRRRASRAAGPARSHPLIVIAAADQPFPRPPPRPEAAADNAPHDSPPDRNSRSTPTRSGLTMNTRASGRASRPSLKLIPPKDDQRGPFRFPNSSRCRRTPTAAAETGNPRRRPHPQRRPTAPTRSPWESSDTRPTVTPHPTRLASWIIPIGGRRQLIGVPGLIAAKRPAADGRG